jgi:hypothetical protein
VYHGRVKALLSYGLAFGGLGLTIYVIYVTLAINLRYPGARLAMLNALRSSINQAEIMCRAVPGTFFEAIGSAIKLGAMAQTTDLAVLAQTTRPGYDATIALINQKWKSVFGHAKKALLLGVAGVALAISNHSMPAVHIIIAVFILGTAIWVFIAKLEAERSILRARAELLPELDAAFAAGRYQRWG